MSAPSKADLEYVTSFLRQLAPKAIFPVPDVGMFAIDQPAKQVTLFKKFKKHVRKDWEDARDTFLGLGYKVVAVEKPAE